MIFLALPILIVPLLYFWLVGHWFARVLMGIITVPLCGFGLAMILSSLVEPTNSAAGIFGMVIGLPVGWFIASAPVWIIRRRDAAFCQPPNYSLTLR